MTMWTRGLSVTARLSNQFLASAKPSVSHGVLPPSGAAGRHDDAGMIPVTRQREWNRAVAHAEKLVGFPTSVFHLQVRSTYSLRLPKYGILPKIMPVLPTTFK